MEKEAQKSKKSLTDKDLVETLMLISETSKTLAVEVMLQEEGGGDKNGTEPDNS